MSSGRAPDRRESYDLAGLSLPWGQDALVPVSMLWREKVKAIVRAGYPEQAGG